ncbi:tRNA (adenosine(37)-N6)-threonylcarbamoyltransferase complex dimerization subunit type 1 TsaB [Microbacterium aerolatum]|uniref:tRNA (adenosine(37)-N6)-threonylcarbamoyltransferase complex dimerization subunit type 1 TsaB n=1 Tax=Microbacterium aerolatum TaxID=153731 RepID=UPI00200118FF|nr:tRNA (adenosine(37)-N6)-threonylcarbamoyltransferase complex dimerization subunit type 1 TsaB [Microbacterium aerolatum]MCK3769720.1 tRNA (adenosine(37)-N6)-threonylcarbamoyltransferase complex dimerization subunit type 1 TsaB [Microbacterium aerolatum]
MILAVDTSLGSAVALIDADGRVRADASSPDPLGHAEVIGMLLQQALAEAGEDAVTHVIAGMGPGPFTGLRIGIATARAFALGRGIPVVPVPSHFGAALAVIDPSTGSGIDATRFAIVTDARRREVAISLFDGVDADGIPNLLEPTVLVPRADADERLRGIHAIEVSTLDAAALARVGLRAANAGRDLAGAEPLYLRQPDVSVPGAPKRVS